MITKLLHLLVSNVLNTLNKEERKELVDHFLDIIEKKSIESTNKIDDAIVIPLCKVIRDTTDIPDDD